ncbi:MAG: aminodeoxychorismate/anthranilate synthase component II [Bacteroidetes bacterium]|nr:aminodeoxychorismate/anthranilate synthase component II [Bacteroidota bacterium]
MILLLDNYDSFTWNLYHYITQLTSVPVVVKRNDEITVEEALQFEAIMLSPGPGLPEEAGVMNELIAEAVNIKPILGICLGHQALGVHFDGKLKQLPKVWHGVQKEIRVTDAACPLFKGLASTFESGHYHSWVVDNEDFPECMKITATDHENTVMALSHKILPIHGVQFHPESVMTTQGLKIIENWLISIGYR